MKKKKEDQNLLEWIKDLLSQFTRGFKHYPEEEDNEEMDISDQAKLGHFPGSDDIPTLGRDDQEEEEKEEKREH